MARHVLGIGALTALIVAVTFLPFLPGSYDAFAVTLSGMAQVFGMASLLLVPIGALWLIFRRQERYFTIAAMVAASTVAALVCLIAALGGISLGVGLFALWTYWMWKAVRRWTRRDNVEASTFDPVPLYLVAVPILVCTLQFVLDDAATESSRRHAIENSAELLNDIEQYHRTHGRYPLSLQGLWPDYKPGVIGISQFHYEPNGAAFNLYFEQLSTRFGTQEIVMYNQLDQHLFASHAAFRLSSSEDQIRSGGGWYAVHDASVPHWKYFWFD